MSAKGSFKTRCVRGHDRKDNVYKNGTCKICNTQRTKKWQEENRTQANVISKMWRDNNPQTFKDCSIMSRYSLSLTQLRKLKSRFKKCECCGKEFSKEVRPHIDHDHSHCKKGCFDCIRGVLCRECNLGIGYFKDSETLLLLAANYIKRSHTEKD